MTQLLLNTTGTPATVTIDDLGDVEFVHPVVNFDLLSEFTQDEIESSIDLQDAITSGAITIDDGQGNTWNGTDPLSTFIVVSIVSESAQYYMWCANSDVKNKTYDQDLRRESNALTNKVPYIVPYDSNIIWIMGKHEDSGDNWDGSILVNDTIQHTLNIDNSANTLSKYEDISVAVSIGDRVRLRFRNASAGINYPQLCIIGKKI